MAGYNELEISLTAGEEELVYQVAYRHKAANSKAPYSPKGGLATIDPDALLQQQAYQVDDPLDYGRSLTESLFADSDVKASFAAARAIAQENGVPLKIRLLLNEVPELESVRWELLFDPIAGSLLCADQDLIFSRFPKARSSLRVQIRPKSQLRALVMTANPSYLDPDKLAPIDVTRENKTATESLTPIHTVTVAEPGSEQRATLSNLIDQLHEHKYDILYLVCHGTFKGGDTLLYLEDDDGQVSMTEGQKLVEEFRRLNGDHRPNLVILASCQSAGDGEGQALTALGPRLAEAGIASVIAMQGKISIKTNQSFMSELFLQLYRHGIVDQAIAAARWHLREQPDFWIPVLFMRLDDGRIWSGFSDGASFHLWPVLEQAIKKERLVPILGTGLVEPIIGSMRDISKMWSDKYGYPMFEYERDAVPQIAQFMSVQLGLEYTKTDLADSLRDKLEGEHPDIRQDFDPDATLDDVIDKLAKKRREQLPQDAYNILARLPLPVYVTANLNKVLETALAEQDRSAHVLISPWNEHIRKCYYGYPAVDDQFIDEDCDGQKRYDFTFQMIDSKNPLVFHPFGRLDDPSTVVLTEDEYFEYLTGLRDQEKQELLLERYPSRRVHSGTLLFLGFHLVDWEFRVLLQTLTAFGGSQRLFSRDKKHIAVIQLDQPNIMKWQEARDYLEKRLQQEWEIYMYVGSSEDFLSELQFYLPASLGGRNRG